MMPDAAQILTYWRPWLLARGFDDMDCPRCCQATDRLASKDEAGAILKPSYGVMREGLNGAT
jgi:hypothetical protein